MTSSGGITFITMKRLAKASAVALAPMLMAALAGTPAATAASNTAVSSINVDPATQIQMHVTANCDAGQNRCFYNTSANLLTPSGPTGFPRDTWARQTVTLRSDSQDIWQEAWYSAPSGTPRELKGANHDNVLSRMLKSLREVEVSVTYFGGGPITRFTTDGDSVPTAWTTGLPAKGSQFIVCSQIQVVYEGVNLTTPSACAQTTFE